MSIDVKDHRRYLETKHEHAAPDKPAPLLEQVNSDLAATGEPYLDKLIRAIEAKVQTHEEHAQEVAFKCAGCAKVEVTTMLQFEFMYTKGRVDAYKEIAQMPAQILAEARPQHSA